MGVRRFATALAIAVCLGLGPGAAAPAAGQTPPPPPPETGDDGAPTEIRLDPVTVEITRCWKVIKWKCTEATTAHSQIVYLEANRAIDVQLNSRALTTADGETVNPEREVGLDQTQVQIDPINGTPVKTIIQLEGLESGEYVSRLTVSHDGGRVSVPVTLRLRDPIEWVLFVLLAGLGVSLGVTAYVVKQRDLDSVLMRVYRLQDRATRDRDIHEVFRAKVLADLDRAEFSIRREDMAGANEHLKSANAVWDKWRGHMAAWKQYLQELDTLCQGVESLSPKNDRLYDVKREINAIRIDVVNDDTPTRLRNKLDELTGLFRHADRIANSLDRLAHMVSLLKDDADNEQKAQCLSAFERLQDDFKGLDLADEAQVGSLDSKINAEVTRLRESANDLLSSEPETPQTSLSHVVRRVMANWAEKRGEAHLEALAQGFTGMVSRGVAGLAAGTGALGRINLDRMVTKVRRGLFVVVGYVVLMVILAGAGLEQLYLSDATFGANMWSDYISLFAWGFGAEATRNSVVRLAGSWQLAGIRPSAPAGEANK